MIVQSSLTLKADVGLVTMDSVVVFLKMLSELL